MLSHEEFFGQNGYVCADLWWDLSRLDIAATYQIDSMMATNFRFITERAMPFDLDGPSSTMLHLKALQETQRAIEDPTRCYSLGTIASVIASIFAAVSGRLLVPMYASSMLMLLYSTLGATISTVYCTFKDCVPSSPIDQAVSGRYATNQSY